MKKNSITESQIMTALKSHSSGRKVEDICRELGVHRATFYTWSKKYSGMEGQDLRRLRELEAENLKLKQMYADVSLDNKMLKDVLSKKW
jgi:putative transposase